MPLKSLDSVLDCLKCILANNCGLITIDILFTYMNRLKFIYMILKDVFVKTHVFTLMMPWSFCNFRWWVFFFKNRMECNLMIDQCFNLFISWFSKRTLTIWMDCLYVCTVFKNIGLNDIMRDKFTNFLVF